MPSTSTQIVSRRLAPALAVCCLASTGCASGPAGAPRVLPPASAVPSAVAVSHEATPAHRGSPVASSADQLRAVSRVVRHWFGRYRARYSDVVRIETLVPHLDTPGWADAFVVATFTDAGSVDAKGRPILNRPRQGRYYRSVQLRLRNGRWHVESVRPT